MDVTKIHDPFYLKILNQDWKSKDLGLSDGLMGECLFLFLLAKERKENYYSDSAESILDTIIENISKSDLDVYLRNGISGIGWTIQFLAKNGFVEGDINKVLSELDDRIFLFIAHNSHLPLKFLDGIIGLGFYLISRIRYNLQHYKNGNNCTLFYSLLIDVINKISNEIDNVSFEINEPELFNITWDMPYLLLLLADTYKLGIYSNKIEHIVEFLSPQILSYIPYNPLNRIIFLISIDEVFKTLKLNRWGEHVKLIRNSFEITKIVDEGLNEKDVNLFNGVSGILLLQILSRIRNCGVFSKEICERINKKIVNHSLDDYGNEKTGLLTGISGIGISATLYSIYKY